MDNHLLRGWGNLSFAEGAEGEIIASARLKLAEEGVYAYLRGSFNRGKFTLTDKAGQWSLVGARAEGAGNFRGRGVIAFEGAVVAHVAIFENQAGYGLSESVPIVSVKPL